MAITAERLQERDLLRDYQRALARRRGGPRRGLAPGWQVRTCASCGWEAAFRVDPEGDWATCSRCGSYA
jgi:hypothetical protein